MLFMSRVVHLGEITDYSLFPTWQEFENHHFPSYVGQVSDQLRRLGKYRQLSSPLVVVEEGDRYVVMTGIARYMCLAKGYSPSYEVGVIVASDPKHAVLA